MSGIDESALYQQAVVLIADRKGSSRLGAAKVILGHVILYSAQQNVNHRFGNGNQFQSSVALTLACESRPSLVGAKHRAHRGRVHFAHLRTIRRIEGVVLAPVSCEDVPVHFPEIIVEPTLYRATVAALTTMDQSNVL